MVKKSEKKKQNLGDNFYRIQEVLRTQTFPDGEYCLVSWVGYPQSDNSWVRKTTVMDLQELVEHKEQENTNQKNKKIKKNEIRNHRRIRKRERKIDKILKDQTQKIEESNETKKKVRSKNEVIKEEQNKPESCLHPKPEESSQIMETFPSQVSQKAEDANPKQLQAEPMVKIFGQRNQEKPVIVYKPTEFQKYNMVKNFMKSKIKKLGNPGDVF